LLSGNADCGQERDTQQGAQTIPSCKRHDAILTAATGKGNEPCAVGREALKNRAAS
jgi:hypothetical protein